MYVPFEVTFSYAINFNRYQLLDQQPSYREVRIMLSLASDLSVTAWYVTSSCAKSKIVAQASNLDTPIVSIQLASNLLDSYNLPTDGIEMRFLA